MDVCVSNILRVVILEKRVNIKIWIIQLLPYWTNAEEQQRQNNKFSARNNATDFVYWVKASEQLNRCNTSAPAGPLSVRCSWNKTKKARAKHRIMLSFVCYSDRIHASEILSRICFLFISISIYVSWLRKSSVCIDEKMSIFNKRHTIVWYLRNSTLHATQKK